MKKLFALALVLVMVLSMVPTAFAAVVTNNTEHDYEVYQVFTGTQAEGETQLGNVEWGNGIDYEALLPAMKERNPEIYSNCQTAADVAVALAGDGTTTSKKGDADKFANFIVDYITDKYTDIKAGDTNVNLPAGYYLLVDVTEVEGETDAKNPALLQVTNNGHIEIKKKYSVPINEKKINVGGSTGEADIAEYSIGDEIEFLLRVTLPMNISDFDTYRLVFHDRMSAGLTFNPDSVTVSVAGGTLTALTDVTADKYDVVYPVTDCSANDDACTFEIVFEDVKTFATNNAVITVRYTATLNEDALINTANPNNSAVEFSNDPDWKPTTEKPNAPTGITPWDEVEVYTTKVQITKKSGATGAILPGAAFRIEGGSTNIVITTGEIFLPYAVEEGQEAPTKYWKLKDGTYTTTDPNTPDLDTSKYANLTTDTEGKYVAPLYMKVAQKGLNTQGENSVNAEGFVDPTTGIISFSGLSVGTYTITEIVTPGGYNTIDEITLVIGFDSKSESFTYAWTGGATGAFAEVTVLNYQGSTLPETGGMGTTLFYALGGIMVLAAVVLLITKKRMSVA